MYTKIYKAIFIGTREPQIQITKGNDMKGLIQEESSEFPFLPWLWRKTAEVT